MSACNLEKLRKIFQIVVWWHFTQHAEHYKDNPLAFTWQMFFNFHKGGRFVTS